MKTKISQDSNQSIAINSNTTVSATIGSNTLITIFGYTSPLSSVELLGKQVYQKTLSKTDGYFEFTELVVPTDLKDACLVSTDTSNRPGPPSCIPLPPIDNQYRHIGPVLLAPSLSISNNRPAPGSFTSLSGQSIPNQKVEVKIFEKQKNPKSFPKQAMAFEGNLTVQTIADPSGNYSLSLPTSYSNQYLIKSQTFWQGNPSPPSFQVAYSLPDYRLTMLQLNPNLILIILFQILFIGLLLFLKRQQKNIHYWLTNYPHSLWPKY